MNLSLAVVGENLFLRPFMKEHKAKASPTGHDLRFALAFLGENLFLPTVLAFVLCGVDFSLLFKRLKPHPQVSLVSFYS